MSQKLMCLVMPMAFALGGCRTMPQSTANTSPSAGALVGSSRMPRLKLPIESAAFWGSTHAWIVTGNGDLLHTQTEGATWTEIPGSRWAGLNASALSTRKKDGRQIVRGRYGRHRTAVCYGRPARPLLVARLSLTTRSNSWTNLPGGFWNRFQYSGQQTAAIAGPKRNSKHLWQVPTFLTKRKPGLLIRAMDFTNE